MSEALQVEDAVTVKHDDNVLHTHVNEIKGSMFNFKLADADPVKKTAEKFVDCNMADEGTTWLRGHVHSEEAFK